MHLVCYTGTLLLVKSPITAQVFAVIQQGVFGSYMGCSFARNHNGMRTIAADAVVDYLRSHQIEHHLFRNMPRPSLRPSDKP